MALKSTIHKANLQITDMDRHYYAAHQLTLAKHPSETEERLMVRLLAFVLFASETLTFAKGLSDETEPDLWQKDLTDAIELWVNVGLPDEREVRKACGRADKVAVVLYGGNVADMWWDNNSKALLKQRNLTVINLTDTKALSEACTRNMEVSCTIQDEQILVAHDTDSFEIIPQILKKI